MAADDTPPERPEYLLTTFDNPFDPFTQWDEWYAFDLHAGYHTPGLLARVAQSSSDLSEADQYLAVQDAIDEIVRENVSGMHRKVKRGETLTAAMDEQHQLTQRQT
jgi:hypothetical protein